MQNFCVIVLVIIVLKLSVAIEQIWHSYQYDPIYRSREELLIENVIADDQFKLNYKVNKWKSIHVDKICYVAGLMERNIAIALIKLDKNQFSQESYVIEFEAEPIDVEFFQYWNSTLKKYHAIAVIATQKSELLWYKIEDSNHTKIWSWSMGKNISHINIFQIDYNYHLLIINRYLTDITGDLYEFELKTPNFWLRQKLPMSDMAVASSFINFGPDYYLAIPQKSIRSLLVYKLMNNHFLPYKNLSSNGIDDVISFNMGHKSFLAFNGHNAGIYKFTKTGLIRESVLNTNLDEVNYWLPIPVGNHRDDNILIAQRSLNHEPHKSFVVEIITYNGDKFEKHEDIKCLYFGEEVYGLSCLLGEDAENGIRGAISVSFDDVLGLLVPRGSFSELFIINTTIVEIPNPLHKQMDEFAEKRKLIDNLITVQEKRYNEIVESQKGLNIDLIRKQLEEMDQEVNALKEQMDLTHFSTIIFNGVVEIQGNGSFEEVQVEMIQEEPADQLLNDIVIKNNLDLISSPKVFTNLEVEDLILESINDINAENLLFKTENITIDGDVVLQKPLMVSGDVTTGTVNGQIFENEIVDFNLPIDELFFDNIEILDNVQIDNLNDIPLPLIPRHKLNLTESDSLFFPNSITVTSINGENFDDFLHQLCLKNIENYIPGTFQVNGDVMVRKDAETDYLNGLQFPQEYVFTENSFPNITGVKNFTNSLTTSEVNCEGTIDDIQTSRIITLTTDQNVPGSMTFKNLKVTESLNVGGQVFGEYASKFLPNPNLMDTNSIKANVHFKDLEVKGSIITENFNGKNFESILNDIVYNDEEEVTIEAMKKFPEDFTVRTNLSIKSNTINDIPLNSIITKDTDQVVNFTTLKGIVTFENVEIDGLYDNVDIKTLDDESVKLDGEQYISSTLIFENEIEADELEVLETINDLTEDQFLDPEEESDFDLLYFNNVIVEGDFNGNINDFNLEDFDRRKLSFTKDQLIESPYTIKKSSVEKIEPIEINEIGSKKFTEEELQSQLKNGLKKGKYKIKNLHVKGSLDIDKINNASAINLGGSLWETDIKKHNLTRLNFEDVAYFENVTIEKLSGVNFERFLNSIIFKNETQVKIKGRKTFLKGLTVQKLIETEHLNNVSISNILTKHGVQEISSPLTVHGDVIFENNVTISENINNIPFESITDIYEVVGDKFKVKGDVLFSRLPYIHNLEIRGSVNDREAEEVTDNIIYKNTDFKMTGETIFDNKVEIGKNMRIIGKINNIDLPGFVSKMVMITKDTDIESPTKFTKSVNIEHHLTIHGNLKATNLNGVNMDNWVNDAIFINKGYLKGDYIFENVEIVDDLRTDYINDIDMNTLVPLRTQQNLPELTFDELTSLQDIYVGNSTNFRNLLEEFENTVTIDTEEDIDSDMEFLGKVYIDGNLEILGTLNNINIDTIVTTNTDQNLTATYRFKSKTTVEGDIMVTGLVNGINLTEWAREGVKISAPYPQNITDNWTIDNDLIFENVADGNGQINGLDLRKFRQEIEDKRNFKYSVERRFIDDYNNMCKDLTYIYEKLNKQIYKFNYFENFQVLDFQNNINQVHHFYYRKKLYLLINEEMRCESRLFIFNSHFIFAKNILIGAISQIITVRDNDLIYFVVRNQPLNQTCKIQGTNLWQMMDYDFIHLAMVEDQELLQESSVPATFYGIDHQTVTEFKISNLEPILIKYRKWIVNEENMAFVPRGLGTGLALRTGHKLIKLNRNEPMSDDFSYETEKIIRGNISEEFNFHLPGRKDNDLVVMKVGIKSSKRKLLAMTSHEETSVKGSFDFIKIYEDVIEGKVFHKVPTYKPSSLISLEFSNGETLLAFMEDESIFQVYEYKGIEGFKHKLSAKLEGSRLFVMTLPFNRNEYKIIGLINKNRITLIKTVMLGNQVEPDLKCSL